MLSFVLEEDSSSDSPKYSWWWWLFGKGRFWHQWMV